MGCAPLVDYNLLWCLRKAQFGLWFNPLAAARHRVCACGAFQRLPSARLWVVASIEKEAFLKAYKKSILLLLFIFRSNLF